MKILASFFYVGYLRPAPGTWGSLAALPAAWMIHQVGGFWMLLALTGLVFGAGLLATKEATEGQEDHDPSWIVIDEVVGMWIALFPVSYGATMMSIDILLLWPGWIAGFALFRLFDIWKPGPIGKADRRADAMGVMLDDVIAGAFASIGVVALGWFWHAVMM